MGGGDLLSMEGNANGHEGNGGDPGGIAKEASGGTGAMYEEAGAGFGKENGTGPGENNENSYDNTRKMCRDQGLVCLHVRCGVNRV